MTIKDDDGKFVLSGETEGFGEFEFRNENDWVMKISRKGVFLFNREGFPGMDANHFAKEVIDILQKGLIPIVS